jgi:hypothetical protein
MVVEIAGFEGSFVELAVRKQTFIAKSFDSQRGTLNQFSSGGSRKCVVAESIFHRNSELEEELR